MYLDSSIKEACSMTRAALIAGLKPYVYELHKYSKDELISTWLSHWGVKELTTANPNPRSITGSTVPRSAI